MAAIIEFIVANKVVLLGALLGISEALALIPSFKSSGVLDFIIRGIKKILGKE